MGAEERVNRETLAERVAALLGAERRIVAIAGAPGSGKTTLAAWLAEQVDARAPGACAALGMDGYHLDDLLLDARGWRKRKGAPHTFDVAGLATLLERLRRDVEDEILAPLFDRDIEIARAGALAIPRSARLILLEGNYLLLDRPPWSALRRLFDLTVRIEASEALLLERLTARWRGYDFSEAALREKLEENDMPNARLVLAGSTPADLLLADGQSPCADRRSVVV